MDNAKSPENITYMLRHLMKVNVPDLLSNSSRDFSDYQQYFSGTGEASQVNYLERKPSASGKFIVYVDGVEKEDGTDFDLDRSSLTITWTGHTPSEDTDNIHVQYQAVKEWIFDDHPALSMAPSYFPRITIEEIPDSTYENLGLGTYDSYNSGPGEYVTKRVSVIIRHKTDKTKREIEYDGIHLKPHELTKRIAWKLMNYVKVNGRIPPWKFHEWKIIRSGPNYGERDFGVHRYDIVLEVKYMETS